MYKKNHTKIGLKAKDKVKDGWLNKFKICFGQDGEKKSFDIDIVESFKERIQNIFKN